MGSQKKEFITPKQVRTRCMISLSQVYNLLKDPVDPIPHYMFGKSYRIVVVEFNEWLERRHKIRKRQ